MGNLSELNYYLEQIKGKSPDFAGKEVRAFLVDKGSRVLKKFKLTYFTDDINAITEIEKKLQNLKESVSVIRSRSVNTPEIVDVFRKNKELFTLEERAPGEAMFILKPFSIAKRANMAAEKFDDISKQNFFIARQLFPGVIARKGKRFINKAIQTLVTAPQEHYDKFVRDVVTISKTEELGLDMYAENVLYDRDTGFHLIDLDLCDLTKEQPATDCKRVQMCLNPLINVSDFWENIVRAWMGRDIRFIFELGKIVEKILLGCAHQGILNLKDKEARDILTVKIFEITARWKFLDKFEEKYKDELVKTTKR